MNGRVECRARNDVACPRCSGWFAGDSAESLESALVDGRLTPGQIQCGVIEEQARTFLESRRRRVAVIGGEGVDNGGN